MTKKLIYLSVLTSLIGASVISLDLQAFQLTVFRALIMIIIVVIILKNVSIDLMGKGGNGYSVKFMLIWFFYSIISGVWVKSYTDWIRAVYLIGLGVMCILIYSKYFRTADNILNAFRTMVIMIIIHNTIGWYEVISGNYMFLSEENIAKYAHLKYPVSTFINLNDFALFLLFSLFITYICFINAKFKSIKLVYIITMVSSALLLIKTDSRGNLIGLIIAIALWVLLPLSSNKWKYPLLFLFTISALFVLLLSGLPDYLFDAAENLILEFSANSDSDSIRLNLIRNGFVFLIKTFGFGTGAGNIEYWMAKYAVYNTAGIVNMHNWWMEILTGYGVIIFVLYMVFYIKLFISLYRRYKECKDKMNRSISLGVICCMAGYIVASISSSSNIMKEWLWVFWAIAIAYQRIGSEVSVTKEPLKEIMEE